MPITQNGHKLSGQAQMGGVWEWTSSVLESYERFKSMDLYPGYTGVHFIPLNDLGNQLTSQSRFL
jgi:hypothetical protein